MTQRPAKLSQASTYPAEDKVLRSAKSPPKRLLRTGEKK